MREEKSVRGEESHSWRTRSHGVRASEHEEGNHEEDVRFDGHQVAGVFVVVVEEKR